MSATVSDQDKDLIKMRAYKVAAEEMGVRLWTLSCWVRSQREVAVLFWCCYC